MLKFFRNKKEVIGIGIVLFFAGTMFTGSLFFGAQSSSQNKSIEQSKSLKNAVAVLGEFPITTQLYYKNLNRIMSDPRMVAANSPELMEENLFEALSLSIEEVIFLTLATESNIGVDVYDFKSEEEKVILNLGLKNKKELKTLLKENKMPYKSFKLTMENSIKIRKYLGLIEQQVSVTDKDLDYKYSQLHLKHILFKYSGETKADALGKANDVFLQIENGLAFDEAVELYSEDESSKEDKGDIGWIGFSQTLPEFESVVFKLEKNQVSKPFKTPLGIHIVTMIEKKNLPRPENFNSEEEKRTLLVSRFNYEKNKYIQRFLALNPLVINDYQLKPIDAKRKQDYESAKNGYQLLASSNPRSPIPNYHLAKVLFTMGDIEEGYRQLVIAETKIEMDATLDFSELHFLLAHYFKEKGDLDTTKIQYDVAIELSKDSLYKLEYLRDEMIALKDTVRLEAVEMAIEELMDRLEAETLEEEV
jgi:hypothetical protein